MQLYLVRPARAVRRSEWRGPGGTRPLTDEGRAQAQAISDWLRRFPITHLACGPSLHCRETLAPLSEELGLPILVDDRLNRDADPTEMVLRMRELGAAGSVICINRGLLRAALRSLVGAAANDLETRCDRGAAWQIDGDPPRATYFAPHRASRDRGAPLDMLDALPLSKRKRRGKRPPRTAVLDMGSTSFHMLVAEWTAEGDLNRVGRERVMLRMGSELARRSEISESLLDRSLDAVRDLCEFAKEKKAEQLVAVATAALREASNGRAALAELEAALGGRIRLLSAEEEARVVYRAIRTRIDLGDRTCVGLDLGGGSLEIVVGRGRDILLERTLPLGVARMHGIVGASEAPSNIEIGLLRRLIRAEIEPLVDEIASHSPDGAVIVGGTARALGRVLLKEAGGRSEDLRGMRVERRDLARLARELSEDTLEERLERPGVSSRRADLLPFGAEILTNALSLLEMQSTIVCDWGLREGVLLDLRDSMTA